MWPLTKIVTPKLHIFVCGDPEDNYCGILQFGTSIARAWMSRWEVGRGTQGRSFKSYDITQSPQMFTIMMYSKLKRIVALHGHEAPQKADLWFGHSKQSVVTFECSYGLSQ